MEVFTGEGGGLYAGPNGTLNTGPGGFLYAGPGGGLYSGPGGGLYTGPDGGMYTGPGDPYCRKIPPWPILVQILEANRRPDLAEKIRDVYPKD